MRTISTDEYEHAHTHTHTHTHKTRQTNGNIKVESKHITVGGKQTERSTNTSTNTNTKTKQQGTSERKDKGKKKHVKQTRREAPPSPVHYPQHLFPDVLRSPERPGLHKVLKAPWVGEFIVFPRVVDSKQGQVISLWLVELGFLLIRHGLFVLLPPKKMYRQQISRNRDLDKRRRRILMFL